VSGNDIGHIADGLVASVAPSVLSDITGTGSILDADHAIAPVLNTAVPVVADLTAPVIAGVGSVIDADHAMSPVLNAVAPVVADLTAPLTADAGNIVGSNFAPALDILGHDGPLASIGDVVANIASFGASGNSIAADLSGIGQNIGSDLLSGLTSVNAANGIGDLVHAVAPVDLSDVGAAIHAPIQDLASTHLDLDQLTSNADLFSHGNLDLGSLLHHA
jgi:hypothetical protein